MGFVRDRPLTGSEIGTGMFGEAPLWEDVDGGAGRRGVVDVVWRDVLAAFVGVLDGVCLAVAGVDRVDDVEAPGCLPFPAEVVALSGLAVLLASSLDRT